MSNNSLRNFAITIILSESLKGPIGLVDILRDK